MCSGKRRSATRRQMLNGSTAEGQTTRAFVERKIDALRLEVFMYTACKLKVLDQTDAMQVRCEVYQGPLALVAQRKCVFVFNV